MGVITTVITKLTLIEQESGLLKREIQTLERQSTINNHQAAAITELTKFSKQNFENDSFQELQKFATELRAKMEKLKTKRDDESQRATFEKLHLRNKDLFKIIGGNGNSNAKREEAEGFLVGLNTC
ncbi:hypothetical protein L2E82_17063 [Cichorium intybus]|uniref:Uncharacterized protein n=1 Tax=Cichorium intybus TaxID=13427 RepID=A0ACB9F790_CICIN|nr:hypothetical protein L2E82_17063 [Cichorium intybus]